MVQSDTPLEITWRSKPLGNLAAAGFDPLLGADMVGGLLSPGSGYAQKYTAESILPNVSEDDLRAAPASSPAWVSQRYLELPDTVPERVRALARDLTANAPTPFDQALAIETYLRKFPYTLEVPAPPINRDAADYFLFDLKKGYCDYYATAMTVLARAAGLPARLVIGYASGTYDPYTAQYVVRQADAHAWTEIYFAGIGWIQFEPTASQPAPAWFGTGQTSAASPSPNLTLRRSGIKFRLCLQAVSTLPGNRSPLCCSFISCGSGLTAFGWASLIHLTPSGVCSSGCAILPAPCSGNPSPDETASEYAIRLTAYLVSLQGWNRLNKWLLSPATAQIGSLTALYTQSLFSPTPLTRADIRSAAQTWGRLRWRLFLANILLA